MIDQRQNEQETKGVEQKSTSERQYMTRKLDAVGWGLFFIWVGIAFLADLGWGVGLVGVGVLGLGEQLARRHYSLNMEAFWVVVSFLFIVGGLWTLLDAQVALVPLLLIVAGLAVLFSAFWGKPRTEDDPCHK